MTHMQQKNTNGFIFKPIETYKTLGQRVEIALTGAMIGNRTSMVVETNPPGGAPPLHVHWNENETAAAVKDKSSSFWVTVRTWLRDLLTGPLGRDLESRCLASVVFTPAGPLVYQQQINRNTTQNR
jgi:hypothetical protein